MPSPSLAYSKSLSADQKNSIRMSRKIECAHLLVFRPFLRLLPLPLLLLSDAIVDRLKIVSRERPEGLHRLGLVLPIEIHFALYRTSRSSQTHGSKGAIGKGHGTHHLSTNTRKWDIFRLERLWNRRLIDFYNVDMSSSSVGQLAAAFTWFLSD